MSLNETVATALLILAAAASPARAGHATPVRPGIMCLSAQALAILTLPDGDSKTHGPDPSAATLAIASAGGCIDLSPAARLTVHATYRNTSRVTLSDTLQAVTYTVPNIDLHLEPDSPLASAPPLAQPAPAPDSAPRTTPGPPRTAHPDVTSYVVAESFPLDGTAARIDLLQDSRITPALFTALWRGGGGPRLSAGLAGHPLVSARLRLVFTDGTQPEVRDLGYPLATLSPPEGGSGPFTLHIDRTAERAGITEEKLTPASHGLLPRD